MFFGYVEYSLFVVVHVFLGFFLFALAMQLFKYYFLTEADLHSTQEICNFLNNPPTDEKMKIFHNLYYEESSAKYGRRVHTHKTSLSVYDRQQEVRRI